MAYRQKRVDEGIKRAALYARVSTEEQAMHGVSLDAQQERLLQYAKENGLTVVDIYVDEGISARKRYTARPEFMRMLDDVKAKKVDVVLFIKLDRWFRNIADYYEVQAILDKYRVQWIATEEDYDTTTANGRLALNIKLAIAQDESDRTSERIKFVFQNMVREGRVISGSTPKGYKIQEKKVVLDEALAPVIKEMFSHYIDTRSLHDTSRYLKETHSVYIDIKSMKAMLQNPWYIGEAYGIKDWCPRIIDDETFQLAGKIVRMRATRNSQDRTERVYLFTGLLFCGACGRRMTTYSCRNHYKSGRSQEYIYYRCPGHTMRLCDAAKQINQASLEKWLIENLCAQAEKHNVEIEAAGRMQKKRTLDKSKIIAKIDKLKNLYLDDLITRELYEKDYNHLSAILKEAIEQEKNTAEQKPLDVPRFRELLDSYAHLEPTNQKAFWTRVIDRITITPTGDILVSLNQL